MENQEKPFNQSAYPIGKQIQMCEKGMTLRDHFAGLAMQAIISNSDTMREITKAYQNGGRSISFESCLADMAFGFSDAMLKQRSL